MVDKKVVRRVDEKAASSVDKKDVKWVAELVYLKAT